MVFLLPASFFKSKKGGEGFRKFSTTRYGQNIPFSIDTVNDFSGVKVFTIQTVVIKITKGIEMKYPMNKYKVWKQMGKNHLLIRTQSGVKLLITLVMIF